MYASSERPDGTAFTQALLSCRFSHINRQVCLISWHAFQIVFATSCPKKKHFVPEEEADFSLISKYILHLLK